jgi:hypothetical protein
LGLFGAVVTAGFKTTIGQELPNVVEAWAKGEGLEKEAKEKRVEEVKSAKSRIEQSLEAVRANTAFIEREKPALSSWVTKL